MGRGAGKNAGAPPGQSGGGTKSWEQPPAPGREKKRGHLRSVSGQPGRPVHRRPRPEPRRRKVRLPPLPPVGESCARSLAPPLQTEPASLGFGLGYCAGATRAGRVGTWQPAHESSFCRRPQCKFPSARSRRWGLAKRRPGTYKTQCALLEHKRAVRRRQTVPTRPEILLPPMGPSNDFPRGAHHPLGPLVQTFLRKPSRTATPPGYRPGAFTNR